MSLFNGTAMGKEYDFNSSDIAAVQQAYTQQIQYILEGTAKQVIKALILDAIKNPKDPLNKEIKRLVKEVILNE